MTLSRIRARRRLAEAAVDFSSLLVIEKRRLEALEQDTAGTTQTSNNRLRLAFDELLEAAVQATAVEADDDA